MSLVTWAGLRFTAIFLFQLCQCWDVGCELTRTAAHEHFRQEQTRKQAPPSPSVQTTAEQDLGFKEQLKMNWLWFVSSVG